MENLIKNQKSIIISSLNKDNLPETSYAPFVMIENDIYVYLSKVANHYYNLITNKNCSVMIIEDEQKSKTIFARERVTFEGEAIKLDDIEAFIFDKFDEVHEASMMSVLKTMDFDMFKISIKKGRYVKGFGKAFDIKIKDGKYEMVHVTDIGHK